MHDPGLADITEPRFMLSRASLRAYWARQNKNRKEGRQPGTMPPPKPLRHNTLGQGTEWKESTGVGDKEWYSKKSRRGPDSQWRMAEPSCL